MIIGILRSGRPRLPNVLDPSMTSRLVEAGQKRSHQMIELFEPEIVIRRSGEETVIEHQGAPLPKMDVIINRPGFVEEPSLHTVTTDALQRKGYRLVNGLPTSSMSKNKLAQHVVLSAAGIPMPTWAIARTSERALEAANTIGFPIMLKVAFGTHGKGVFLAENLATFMPIVDYLAIRDGNPVILEKFIDEAAGKDLRAFVVGGQIVASMERTAKNGDVRANASIGGVGAPVVLTDEEQRLAIAATKAFQLDIAGVDILRSKNGPLVMEVNANPGFEELERATGVDVAGAIIDFAVRSSNATI